MSVLFTAPPGTFYDGDHYTPWQVGPIRPWVDPGTRGALYERTMRVFRAFWEKTAQDDPGPEGGFLVEESKPTHVGGAILEWVQTFMSLPPGRSAAESISYPIQLEVSKDGTKSLAEIPITTTATMVYDYWHTGNPSSIPILHAFREAQIADNLFYFIGTKPTGDASIVAIDSQVRPVRAGSNFYERRTAWVPNLATLLQQSTS